MSYSYDDKWDNPRYRLAVGNRIRENARRGKNARWLLEDPTRPELMERVRQLAYDRGGFWIKMSDAYDEWGALSEKQEAACRRIIAENDAKREQRAAERKAEGANSEHLGVEGERRPFELELLRIAQVDTDFGTMHIHTFREGGKNIVVYKGKNLGLNPGDKVNLVATIKRHNEYQGTAQTVVSRPRVA